MLLQLCSDVIKRTGSVPSYLWTSCVFSCFSLLFRSPLVRLSFSSSVTFFSKYITWKGRCKRVESLNLFTHPFTIPNWHLAMLPFLKGLYFPAKPTAKSTSKILSAKDSASFLINANRQPSTNTVPTCLHSSCFFVKQNHNIKEYHGHFEWATSDHW